MIPAKHFDLCPWGGFIAMPHLGWQHAGWLLSYATNANTILEYGCGGGTLWLAQLCRVNATIVSIEHNEQWADKVAGVLKLLQGSGLYCNPSTNVYHAASLMHYAKNARVSESAPYDLIVVDGMEPRSRCLDVAHELLADGGVVFLHDSQRPQYAIGKRDLLAREGMTLIDERVDESWVNQKAGLWAAQKSPREE